MPGKKQPASNSNSQDGTLDVIVVGAGAAGLSAAIWAAKSGVSVLILERAPKVGAKILVSGGTRCNVTNQRVTESNYNGGSQRLVRQTLKRFDDQKTKRWFEEELGIPLKLEPTGKFFPVSDDARDVVDGLLGKVQDAGAALLTGQKVISLSKEADGWNVETESSSHQSKAIIVCTGGLSLPKTGSDGLGYQLVERLGHHRTKTWPALTPLMSNKETHHELAGISVDCELSLWVNGRKQVSFQGPILFTHFGYSGPVALNLSRHWENASGSSSREILLNFFPGQDLAGLQNEFLEKSRMHGQSSVGSWLGEKLPRRLMDLMLKETQISEDLSLSQCSREKRIELLKRLTAYPLPVQNLMGYHKAEVTAGGINVDEVEAGTLMSRIVPGLFFAGEILDVDGQLGGFNFQWAWSSGYVAGTEAARFVRGRDPLKSSNLSGMDDSFP